MPNRYTQAQEIEEEITSEPQHDAAAEEGLLTVKEAARRLRISRTTLYPYVMSGELESVQIGARRLIPADAVAEFMTVLRKPDQAEADDENKVVDLVTAQRASTLAGPDPIEEIFRLLAVINSRSDSGRFVLTMSLGLRSPEVTGLTWSEVQTPRPVLVPAELLADFRGVLSTGQTEAA